MGRHAIHLGAAWEAAADAASDEPAPWRRWFHRPTGLKPGDRLVLSWVPAAGMLDAVRLSMNGLELPPVTAAVTDPPTDVWECDVTAIVRDRNELRLRVPADVVVDVVSGGRTALPDAWGRLSLVIVSD